MTTYIAEYEATHEVILIKEHSCFTWQQEGGEIDMDMLMGKIKRESSIHFFNLLAGSNYKTDLDDVSIKIVKTETFKG